MNTIEIKNLNKKIKGAEVLKDINLHLEGGKVYGLKGKNGSGKTMLMRAVCGLILPTGGSITINGEQLGKQISFPRSVGILIENPSFIPGYTGLKNLSALAAIQKRVMHAPFAPASKTPGSLSGVMPPMAYTGRQVLSQTSFKKASPRPASPALHSVS